MRAKLQADDPDMGFGDLGRRLGEMWHSLTEDEKEDYRYRTTISELYMFLNLTQDGGSELRKFLNVHFLNK